VVGLVVAIMFVAAGLEVAFDFVEQDQDRRVESRMDEILTVLNRLEARLAAAEHRPGATPDDSPARPAACAPTRPAACAAACPAEPGSPEALHLSRDRRFAGAPHEPG
jgi:hypothetical protein